jgi:hypothetical protein
MRTLILAISLLLAGTAYSAPQTDPDAEREALANGVVDMLAKSETARAASSIHYPAAYSQAEREKDVASVAESLDFLIERFGTLIEFEKRRTPIDFYSAEVSGGTVEYWASLSPLDTIDFVYSAEFSKSGSGVIILSLFRRPSFTGPQVFRLGFGLPLSRPGAKAFIIDATVDMLKSMELSLPPNIRELIESSIQVERFETNEEH